jgi:class 3 adenylate cyclase
MAMLFAATYPERTSALMVWNTSARWTVADDYPTGLSQEATDALYRALVSGWGSEDLAKVVDPDLAGDEEHNRFLAKLARAAMTPRAVAAQLRMRFELDARAVLPMIRVPTLVLQRRDNAVSRREHGLYIAEHIPGAKYVEIPGRDLAYFTGVDELCDEVEEFLTGIRHVAEPDRVLATVLFSDIVESTARAASLGDRRWKEVLDLHDKTARARVDEFGGRLVKMTGDGVLATFDLPGKAIRCAADLITALRAAGLEIRVGLHTGEIELRGEDVAGIAVVIGARVMSEAGPAEIACSRTVRDLVAGSGFEFEDRGLRSLKGVPESWQIFAVRNAIDPRH